jgi:histidine ammonia-lyase
MILLDGASLTLAQLIAIAVDGEPVAIAADAARRVRTARAVVDRAAEGGEPVYGINTGFGSFAEVMIAPEALEALQGNLVRSHAAGLGAPLSISSVRAAMALRANVLAKGFSGIRLETLEALIAMLNARVHPLVPSRGSVGASGDLAPLAHIALVLIGEGHAWDERSADEKRLASGPPPDPPRSPSPARATWRGVVPTIPGIEALRRAGLKPVRLGPKEGLALINGTQPSTAILALTLEGADRLARAADIAAALSIDALRGSVRPFDARIHEARGVPGQIASAANIERLMAGSGINRSHQACGHVQDAYSMRCAAQVHGAVREALDFIRRIVEAEANAGTDNPMVFVDTDEIVSGGNFHGAPIALAADLLAIALVPLATISERRIDRLLDPVLSGLPPFLTREGGLQSGLMLAQVTAAAAASELKTLAHPAGVDTIPTSANQEDHVSMSMAAALKAARSLERAREVVAIEILCASQAIDLLAPLQTSPALVRARDLVRSRVATLDNDRPPSPDIIAITELIETNELSSACGVVVK